MDEPLELMADGDFSSEIEQKIEFFYKDGMGCPIEGCNKKHFASKSKYQRHWDEQHFKLNVCYHCPVKLCKQICRRKTDLKSHLRTVHQESMTAAERLLTKAQKEVRENQNFIDPRFFDFLGRRKIEQSAQSTSSTSTKSTSSLSSITSSTPTSSPSIQVIIPKSIPADTTSSSLTSRISVEEYRARLPESRKSASVDTHSGYSSSSSFLLPLMTSTETKDSSSQTSCLDLPPLVLPELPDSRPELEAYLRWLCNSFDQIGRMRESAKRKLEEIKEVSALQIERAEKKKLEEVNKLKKELAECRWRASVFDEWKCENLYI